MSANKMIDVQLHIASPVHIGGHKKVDRNDDNVLIDYRQDKIIINNYEHPMFIHNLKNPNNFESDKKLKGYKGQEVNVIGSGKHQMFIINDKQGSDILFDDERLISKLKLTKEFNITPNLNLTNIEYLNVALRNPVAVFPYNSKYFYIPGSSLKGAIKQSMATNDFEDLFLERCVADCKIESKNAFKIETIHKFQYLDSELAETKIKTNHTNQKQFLKQGQNLTLSINQQLYEIVKYNAKDNNQIIANKLKLIDSRYKKVVEQFLDLLKAKLKESNQNSTKNAVNEKLGIIGLSNVNQPYTASKLHANINKLIDTIENSNDPYFVIGSNKGKQMIFEEELDSYGLNFIDQMPLGIIKLGEIK